MAVEHPQRPGREHQKAGHREHDLDRRRGEGVAVDRHLPRRHAGGVAEKTGAEHGDDRPGEGEPDQGEGRRRRQQQTEDGAGEAPGLALPPLLEHAAVDRDEGGGDRPLAEQVLEQVGGAEGGLKDVGVRPDAEEVGDGAFAQEADQAAGEDPRRHGGGAAGAGGSGGRFLGHRARARGQWDRGKGPAANLTRHGRNNKPVSAYVVDTRRPQWQCHALAHSAQAGPVRRRPEGLYTRSRRMVRLEPTPLGEEGR